MTASRDLHCRTRHRFSDADIASARRLFLGGGRYRRACDCGGSFSAAVQTLHGVTGRVIVSGMGERSHRRKIAATLVDGTPSHYVHPGEASHGDLGMVMREALRALNSGETPELRDIAEYTAFLD